jgi:hypothetical protein
MAKYKKTTTTTEYKWLDDQWYPTIHIIKEEVQEDGEVRRGHLNAATTGLTTNPASNQE